MLSLRSLSHQTSTRRCVCVSAHAAAPPALLPTVACAGVRAQRATTRCSSGSRRGFVGLTPAPRVAMGGWYHAYQRVPHRTPLEVAPEAKPSAREGAPLQQLDDGEGGSSSSGSSSSGRDGGIGQEDPLHNVPVDWLATGACFAFPALGGLLFGFDIGATSGVLSSLTSERLSGVDWWQLTPLQSGLVVSMSLLGALAGSLAALTAGNRLGRRTELLMASVLYGAAAAAMGGAQSLPWLLAGRLTYGVGIGFAMHAAPAYIAETSPPAVRGLLISLKEAAIVGGILLGYCAAYVFAEEPAGWRSIYGCAAPLALILGAGMLTLPESPRWLVLSGAKRDAAAAALARAEGRRLADPSVLEAELDGIVAAAAAAGGSGSAGASSSGGGGVTALLTQPRYQRPLLVGCSLMLFQQITGQPSVLYYAQQVFEAAGFASGQAAASVSVLLGGFKLVATGVAVATVDRWGRRPLLLTGVAAMVAALVLLGTAQGFVASGGGADGAAGGGGAAAWASAAALLVYVGAYQVSFGPISWLIVGEVFPLAVRGQAVAAAAIVNYGSNFAVSLALPSVEAAIGLPATYLGFAAIGAAALASIYATVPETKGKTLEEIEAMWGGGPQQQQR